MNILVIGCDQVGASLIRDLERIGHDISLIERDPEQLKRLDAFDDYRFGGTALVGDPTDPDVLRRDVYKRQGIIALRLVLVSNAPSTRIRPAAEIYDSGESMALENFSKQMCIRDSLRFHAAAFVKKKKGTRTKGMPLPPSL